MTECSQDCAGCENNKAVQRPQKTIKDLTTRLNRIEGQVKGVKSMIERGVYCDDILTQIAAIQSAMSSVAKLLLEGHMRACVAKRLTDGDDTVIDELIKTVGRLL